MWKKVFLAEELDQVEEPTCENSSWDVGRWRDAGRLKSHLGGKAIVFKE